MYYELIFIFALSFAVLFLSRKVAKRVGLVDAPNARKLHAGAIPLVGGVTFYILLVSFLLVHPDAVRYSGLLILCITILIVTGVLDDRFELSARIRLIIEAVVTLIMVYGMNIELSTVGDILGFGAINLGDSLSLIITVFAVIGIINAFNMVDGIDGLLGVLSIVTFGSLSIFFYNNNSTSLAYFCIVLICILLPYIAMNVGLLGRQRKVFMGDAGSMVIGFLVVWLLLYGTQTVDKEALKPVTALWIIAIPLMDMVSIIIRRVKKGKSPFKPDRGHLHHIFQRLGFSTLQTLFIILFISASMAAFGMFGEFLGIPELVMFILFVATFYVYNLSLSKTWKVTKRIKKFTKKFN